MSGEREAFMSAILADPDDDTPRLVFADWLDENGSDDDKAHAALIRAQCRLEVPPVRSKERRVLKHEADAILKEHGHRWAKELADLGSVRSWSFHRGFLDGITISATQFAAHAEAIFKAAPTIRTATFPDASNEVGRLAKCEYLSRLASVNLQSMCGCGFCPIHNDLRALFGSKHTANLTSLNIARDRIDADGAKRLAKSAALARLTSLDVSLNPLGDDGVAELGKSKHLKQLVSLNLTVTGFGEAGLIALAAFKNMPALRTLLLSGNQLSAALKAFVASPLFAQLTTLDLRLTGIGDEGVKVLAAIPEIAKLTSLDVRQCQITEKGKTLLKKRFPKGVKV